MSTYDNYLLRGEPGGAGDDVENDRDEVFNDAHPRCESCSERLCAEVLEACVGGCVSSCAPVGFEYDGHAFCAGACADDTRSIIAEDIASEMAHGRGERCAVPRCYECELIFETRRRKDIRR